MSENKGEILLYQAPEGNTSIDVKLENEPTGIYSLEVIISVGYRVKSSHGTQFRIWANKVLID